MGKFLLLHRQNRRPKGGILLSAIGLLFLVSVLFYTAIENRRLTADIARRTQRAHVAEIMEEIFWHHYTKLPEKERPAAGTMTFNTGQIEFGSDASDQGKLKLRIWIDGRSYAKILTADQLTDD